MSNIGLIQYGKNKYFLRRFQILNIKYISVMKNNFYLNNVNGYK